MLAAKLNKMADRVRCAIGGHLRGKLDKPLTTQAAKVYRCPRCSDTWERKISQKATA